jgi:hypothetical protein
MIKKTLWIVKKIIGVHCKEYMEIIGVHCKEYMKIIGVLCKEYMKIINTLFGKVQSFVTLQETAHRFPAD